MFEHGFHLILNNFKTSCFLKLYLSFSSFVFQLSSFSSHFSKIPDFAFQFDFEAFKCLNLNIILARLYWHSRAFSLTLNKPWGGGIKMQPIQKLPLARRRKFELRTPYEFFFFIFRISHYLQF